jgi:hypothetical protein
MGSPKVLDSYHHPRVGVKNWIRASAMSAAIDSYSGSGEQRRMNSVLWNRTVGGK